MAFSYHPSLFDLEPDILPSRDCTRADLEQALALLAAGRLSPEWIPTQEFDYHDAPMAYRALQSKTLMRAIFRWV